MVAKAEDTTIGACNNCGVFWRSAWLFCKNCGMARANALVNPSDLLPAQSSIPTLATDVYQPELDLSESAAALSHCPYCAAEVVPGSRFCEVCGGKLRAATTGELNPPVVSDDSLRPQIGALTSEETALEIRPHSQNHTPAPEAPPMLNEPPLAEMAVPVSAELNSGNRPAVKIRAADSLRADFASDVGAGKRETVQLAPVSRTGGLRPERKLRESTLAGSTPSATVVIPIASPAPRARTSPSELRARSRRAVWQGGAVLGIAFLLALVTGVLVWRSLSESPAGDSRQAPVTSQPTVQPPLAATTQPTPAPSASPSIEVPEGMVYISGGAFEMGRDDGDKYERPAHIVTVGPFFIDRTEVTNQQYREFVERTGHRPPPHWKNGQYPDGEDRLPVIKVSWNDANAYARWAGKRLPTEEEWEFAARGTDGRLYPWGQDWKPELANTKESGSGRVVEVGRYGAGTSPYGLLDLCGNVWEWTSSDPASYANGKEIEPGKVVRGGAYNSPHDKATTTYRGILQPEEFYDKTGFRCVRDAR